jgi:hypothetical protein
MIDRIRESDRDGRADEQALEEGLEESFPAWTRFPSRNRPAERSAPRLVVLRRTMTGRTGIATKSVDRSK